MSDRDMNVRITATDQASDDFQRIGQNARRMGQDVDQAGKQAERGFRGVGDSAKRFGDSLDEIGTAVGVVTGAMALLGRNALDNERSVSALERAYGSASGQIIDFTEAIQDSTNFSNDAARQAALTGASLSSNYGLSADAIQRLIEVSADLAQVHGVTLPDAMSRVAGAIRGEGEAAELLGLNLSDSAVAARAAAAGLDGWTTTMTESEKAAFRYALLLEDTARFAGAAGEAAQGAAGRGAAFRDWLDDTAESAGRALGPTGEFLSISGDLALAAPLAGNAIGRLAQGMGSLTFLANPLTLAIGGVAAVAGTAYLAYRALHDEQDRLSISTEEFGESVDGLIGTLLKLEASGTSQAGLSAVRTYTEELFELGRASIATEGPLAEMNAELDRQEQLLSDLYQARSGIGAPENIHELIAAQEAYVASLEAQRDAMEAAHITDQQFAEGQQAIAAILGDTAAQNYPELIAEVERLTREYDAGRLSADDYIAALVDLGANAETFGLTLDSLTPRIARTDRAIGDVTTGLVGAGSAATDFGGAAADTAGDLDDLTFSVGEASSGMDDLGGSAENAGQGIGGLEGPLRSVGDVVDDLTAAWAGLGDQLDANAAHQAEVARAVERGTAAAESNTAAVVAAAQAANDAVRAANAERQREVEAAIAARDAAYEAADANRAQAVSLDEAAAAMGSMGYASWAAVDGVVSLTEQQRLLTVQGAELEDQQSAVASQLGFYRGAVNDMEAAYEELQARQAAGEALNQSDIDFMREYEAEADGTARTIGDLVIEQGKLAQAQIDNAEAQEGLTETMGDVGETFGEVGDQIELMARVLAEMLGLDLDDLAPPEAAASGWRDLAAAIDAASAKGQAATASASTSGYVVTGPNAAGTFTSAPPPQTGHARAAPTAAPANLPPPSQGLLVPVSADTAAARAELEGFIADMDGQLDALVGEERTVEILGDGDDLVAVVRDAGGEVDALVLGEHVVNLSGDNTDALAAIGGAARLAAQFDGTTASAYILANASQFYSVVNAIDGTVQGTAYIRLVGIGGAGLSGVERAGGGVIPEAASGTVVRAGEIGPELVYPPGGAPYLAARDGLYVMRPGSYVANAAATGARAGRPSVGPITINVYAQDGRDAGRQIQAALRSFGR